VRAYLQQFGNSTTGPMVLGLPKVRAVTTWLLRHPDIRWAEQHLRLKQVLTNCAHLAATAKLVSTFGERIWRTSHISDTGPYKKVRTRMEDEKCRKGA
jgi:hypothetical protein